MKIENREFEGVGVVSVNNGAIVRGMQDSMVPLDKKNNLLHCLHIAENRTICKTRGGSIHDLVATQHEPIAGLVAELST